MSEYVPSNSVFSGSYQNPTEPYWARAASGTAIGPDIQVSTIQTNAEGYIVLNAEGTVTAPQTAFLEFNRTSDVANPTPTLVSMIPTIPLGGGVPTENISIVNNTKTYYDPLAVGNLIVYGINDTVLNPIGAIAVIEQVGTTSDAVIQTTGLHVSSLYISTINGDTFPGGNLGPDAQFSTINMNDSGFIRFNAAGTSNAFLGGQLFFQKSPDIVQTYSQSIKMAPNNLGNILSTQTVENISITHVDDVKSPPGLYYDNLALGDLYIYGTNNPKASTIGQVAVFQEYLDTTDVECVTTGFHVDNLLVSTINGLPPGGGSGPNLLVSTLTVNETGNITMRGNGTILNPSTSQILFSPILGVPGGTTTYLGMKVVNETNPAGASITNEIVAFTKRVGFGATPYYEDVAAGNLYIYGTNTLASAQGQLAVLEQWSTTSTDVQCRTTGFHTSSIYASSITCPTLQIPGNAVFSSITVSSISGTEATVPLINASTIAFNPSLGGVKFPLDLGLGEFFGAAAGTFAGETVTMSLAGIALTTGLVGMIAPRTTNNIYPPGQPSTFQTINLQTQLQYSTLGSAVSSFYRFVSSSDGSMGTITPGFEYIVSSIVQPGTVCIRSFSDPMNLANPSTFTSTVQSFGYWVPVPQQPVPAFSTVTGDFVVQSTLTAYKINVSTSVNALGTVQAGYLQSAGIVSAATNINAGGNVVALGQGQFTGGVLSGGAVTAPSLQINGNATVTGTVVANIGNINLMNANQVSTTQVTALNLISPTASLSNITVSSINGFPYIPGSGGTLGVFSTLFVSSVTNTSSLSVTAGTTTGSLLVNNNAIITSTFTSSIITNQLIALGIGATSISFGSPTPTLLSDTGIYNPIGQINYGQGIISSIQNNVLWNKTTSTQALFVSTVNGAVYPPPYNSTIIGNFKVTSTMSANEVFAFGDITTLGNIGASGNIIGGQGDFTGVVVSGALTANNAIIGGVIIGPAGVVSGTQITAPNVNLTTINGAAYPPNTAFSTVNGNFNVRSTLTAYNANISTNMVALGNITGATVTSLGVTNTLTLAVATSATIPVITGLTQVNGSAYPPPAPPTVSTFQQLFTSSFQASTITTAGNVNLGGTLTTGSIINAGGTVTAPSFSSPGNYNGLSATYPGVNISIAGSGNISAGNMLANSAAFISTNVSSFFVSSINNAPYPPTSASSGIFSTILVSSLATVGSLASGAITSGAITASGSITAPGGVIGGVTLTGGAVTAALVTGTQVNTNSITVAGNTSGNAVIAQTGISYFSTIILTDILTGAGVNPRVHISSIETDSIRLSTPTYLNELTPQLVSIINTNTLAQASYQAEGVFSYGVGGGSGSLGWYGPNNLLIASSFSISAKRTTITDGIITTDAINTKQLYAVSPIDTTPVIIPYITGNTATSGAVLFQSAITVGGGIQCQGNITSLATPTPAIQAMYYNANRGQILTNLAAFAMAAGPQYTIPGLVISNSCIIQLRVCPAYNENVNTTRAMDMYSIEVGWWWNGATNLLWSKVYLTGVSPLASGIVIITPTQDVASNMTFNVSLASGFTAYAQMEFSWTITSFGRPFNV